MRVQVPRSARWQQLTHPEEQAALVQVVRDRFHPTVQDTRVGQCIATGMTLCVGVSMGRIKRPLTRRHCCFIRCRPQSGLKRVAWIDKHFVSIILRI